MPLADSSVVTVAGSSAALPGTEAGSVKVTPLAEYPGKGRATGGVRAHRFLQGENRLLLAWAGPPPAIAAAPSGTAIDFTSTHAGRRDGSGTPLTQPLGGVGTRTHGVRPSAGSLATAGVDANPGEDVADADEDALF